MQYLNNVVEQDHRTVKKRTWLAKGYGSFPTAWRTLEGIEAVNMIRKGRVRWVARHDAVAAADFIISYSASPPNIACVTHPYRRLFVHFYKLRNETAEIS